MERPLACDDLRADLPALAGGAASPELAALAASHAAACPPCARLLARETKLVAMLRGLPAAPDDAPLAVPRLPDHAPAGRLRTWPSIAAACAAAAVVAALWLSGAAPDAPHQALLPAELRFVDVAGAAPDDRILLLTAGPEAVAARRPATQR